MTIEDLLAKAESGKKLTQAERARLDIAAGKGLDGSEIVYAMDFVELSEVLNIPRTTLNDWRKKPGAPRTKGNGRHSVNEWCEFIEKNGLRGEPVAVEEGEAGLKVRKLLAEVQLKELKVQIEKGEYIEREEVRVDWTKKVNGATMLLRKKFEQELPPILLGLDAIAIQEENRRAIDEVLAILHAGQDEDEPAS